MPKPIVPSPGTINRQSELICTIEKIKAKGILFPVKLTRSEFLIFISMIVNRKRIDMARPEKV